MSSFFDKPEFNALEKPCPVCSKNSRVIVFQTDQQVKDFHNLCYDIEKRMVWNEGSYRYRFTFYISAWISFVVLLFTHFTKNFPVETFIYLISLCYGGAYLMTMIAFKIGWRLRIKMKTSKEIEAMVGKPEKP